MNRIRVATTTPDNPRGEIRLLRTQSSLVGMITVALVVDAISSSTHNLEREYEGGLCRSGDRIVTDLLNFDWFGDNQRRKGNSTDQNTRRYFTVLSPLFASRWSTTQEVFVTSFTLMASRAEKKSLSTSYPLCVARNLAPIS